MFWISPSLQWQDGVLLSMLKRISIWCALSAAHVLGQPIFAALGSHAKWVLQPLSCLTPSAAQNAEPALTASNGFVQFCARLDFAVDDAQGGKGLTVSEASFLL